MSAKYGEKSVYFDLGEVDNTTGNWDLYGNDDPNRYNGFQVSLNVECSNYLNSLRSVFNNKASFTCEEDLGYVDRSTEVCG